jgi:hypothetical protein
MTEDTLTRIAGALEAIRADIQVLASNQQLLNSKIEWLDVEQPISPEQVHRLLMDVADIERRTRSLEAVHHG